MTASPFVDVRPRELLYTFYTDDRRRSQGIRVPATWDMKSAVRRERTANRTYTPFKLSDRERVLKRKHGALDS